MGKFIVDYTFHGRASKCIHAPSQEEAMAAVEREVNSDDFDIEADEYDDVDFTVREMHPVTRDGREIWTTRVLPADVRGHQSALAESPLFDGLLGQA